MDAPNREVIQPRWGVFILKRKAERLSFTVTGRTSEEAIERAIKEYAVPERKALQDQRAAGGFEATEGRPAQ